MKFARGKRCFGRVLRDRGAARRKRTRPSFRGLTPVLKPVCHGLELPVTRVLALIDKEQRISVAHIHLDCQRDPVLSAGMGFHLEQQIKSHELLGSDFSSGIWYRRSIFSD